MISLWNSRMSSWMISRIFNILKVFDDNAFIQTGKYSPSTSSKSSTTSMTSWSNKTIDDFVVELKK